jgi:enoyl-CoA hydratase
MTDTATNPSPAGGAVQVEKLGDVTVVTLSRPAVRNAVDSATALALYQAFVAFEQDPCAKVAVFHGAHGHFCAGWDLQFGAQFSDNIGETGKMLEIGQMSTSVNDSLLSNLNFLDFDDALSSADAQPNAGALEAADPSRVAPIGPMGPSRLMLSKPVIAAVSGAAVAGGMELALWCDLRVMEADAYFGVYCRRFGVPLIDGGTVRLPRLVGMGHAMDLILTGRKVEATEALHIGLANRVVPTGAAREAAITLARQLAAFPQKTMRADRESAYAQWGLPLTEALRQEWAGGKPCIAEGVQGAVRFASGQGRHGEGA